MADELLIQGAIESAEVVDEIPQTHKCSCGFELQISGGVLLNAGLRVLNYGAKNTECPRCKQSISLEQA